MNVDKELILISFTANEIRSLCHLLDNSTVKGSSVKDFIILREKFDIVNNNDKRQIDNPLVNKK